MTVLHQKAITERLKRLLVKASRTIQIFNRQIHMIDDAHLEAQLDIDTISAAYHVGTTLRESRNQTLTKLADAIGRRCQKVAP